MTTASSRSRATRAVLQDEVRELRSELAAARAGRAVDLGGGGSTDLEDADRVMRELGAGGARVQLWRVRRDGRPEYIRTYAPGEWSIDQVRDEFGGGSYVARSLDADDVEISKRSFLVAEPRSRAPVASDLGVDLAALYRAQHPNGAPASDPWTIAAQMQRAASEQWSAFSEMMAPLLTRGSGDNKLLETVVASLLAREHPDPIDMILRMRKLLPEANGNGDDALSAALVRDVGAPLVRLLERRAGATRNGVSTLTREEAEAMPDPRIPTPSKRTPFARLAPLVPELVELAGAGEDAELWGAALAGDHPEDVGTLITIVGTVGEERALRACLDTWPQLAPHETWVRKLLQGALAAMTEGDAE